MSVHQQLALPGQQYDRNATGAWFSITDDNISISHGAKLASLANMNVGTWKILKKVDDIASCCLKVINRSTWTVDTRMDQEFFQPLATPQFTAFGYVTVELCQRKNKPKGWQKGRLLYKYKYS